MTWKSMTHLAIFLVLSAALISCGASTGQQPPIILYGHVDLTDTPLQSLGPVFIAVLDKSQAEMSDSFSDALVTSRHLIRSHVIFLWISRIKGSSPVTRFT